MKVYIIEKREKTKRKWSTLSMSIGEGVNTYAVTYVLDRVMFDTKDKAEEQAKRLNEKATDSRFRVGVYERIKE